LAEPQISTLKRFLTALLDLKQLRIEAEILLFQVLERNKALYKRQKLGQVSRIKIPGIGVWMRSKKRYRTL